MFHRDEHFIALLRRPPQLRSEVEVRYISYFLQTLEAVNHVSKIALHALAKSVYYDSRLKGQIVYNAFDVATCWYVLLAGEVFLDGAAGPQTCHPPDAFGMDSTESGQRGYACYATQPSEFIVIDYPNKNICPFVSTEQLMQRETIDNSSYEYPTNTATVSHTSRLSDDSLSPSSLDNRPYRQKARYSSYSEDVVAGPHNYYLQGGRHIEYHNLMDVMGAAKVKNRSERRTSYNNRLSLSSDCNSSATSDGGGDSQSGSLGSRLDEAYRVRHDVVPPPILHNQIREDSTRASTHDSSGSTKDDSRSSHGRDDLYMNVLIDAEYCMANYWHSTDEVRILRKTPADRTQEETLTLNEFFRHFKAFSSMTDGMRVDLCQVMKFACIESRDTVVFSDGEQLDSWCVIINGSVLVVLPDSSRRVFDVGDSFGISRKMGSLAQFHVGCMTTMRDDCQFVAVPQPDYLRVVDKHDQLKNLVFEGEHTVLVTETRDTSTLNPTGSDGSSEINQDHIVIKGTPERLVSHLVEDQSPLDATYVEDFLLTYRTFIEDPTAISGKLEKWYSDQSASTHLKDRVCKVLIAWVLHQYIDFEVHTSLSFFLEKMYDKMAGDQRFGDVHRLARIANRKGKLRKVELDKISRKDGAPFNLTSPFDGQSGVFIKTFKQKVEGLKVGDQIMAINNKNTETSSATDALQLMLSQDFIWLTVKHNVLGMKRVHAGDKDNRSARSPTSPSVHRSFSDAGRKLFSLHNGAPSPIIAEHQKPPPGTNKTANDAKKLKKLAKRFSFLPSTSLGRMVQYGINSASNPDVSQILSDMNNEVESDFGLKVYTSEQNFKYFNLSHLSTTRDIVNRATAEFQLENPTLYSLYQVHVTKEGMVKQSRLPDQMKDMASRIRPATRFYLKRTNDSSSSSLLPPEAIHEMQKEANVSFLDLKPLEVAVQMTLRDLEMLQKINGHQYIEMLFKLPPPATGFIGYTTIDDFSHLSNREMFWVIHTICTERSVSKRAKCIKRFIKLAKYCREVRNLNSMFAVLSGLTHCAISRLHATWEKVSSKDMKLFNVLQEILDPSRNMAKYRNLLSAYRNTSPIIPIFPIAIKDLTVFHLANETKIDGLINFDKLRLISREIRSLQSFISAKADRDFLKSLTSKSKDYKSGNERVRDCSKSSSDLTCNYQPLPVPPPPPVSKSASKPRKSIQVMPPSAKKLYEDILMSRRVGQYINNLIIEEDEEVLRAMSYAVEPPDETSFSARFNIQPLNPPPTGQQTSSQQLMFGTRSQEQLDKILALESSAKPRSRRGSRCNSTNSAFAETEEQASEASGSRQDCADRSSEPSSVVTGSRGGQGDDVSTSSSSNIASQHTNTSSPLSRRHKEGAYLRNRSNPTGHRHPTRHARSRHVLSNSSDSVLQAQPTSASQQREPLSSSRSPPVGHSVSVDSSRISPQPPVQIQPDASCGAGARGSTSSSASEMITANFFHETISIADACMGRQTSLGPHCGSRATPGDALESDQFPYADASLDGGSNDNTLVSSGDALNASVYL